MVQNPGATQAGTNAGNSLAQTNSGDAVKTNVGVTSVNKKKVMTLTIAASGADITDFYLLYKVSVPEASRTLQSNSTYTGDFANWAAFVAYTMRIPMKISRIRIWTSNTSNYSGRLIIGSLLPNNVMDEQYIELADYRKSNGNGYSDYIEITDVPFFTGGIINLRLSKLLDGSNCRILLDIESLGIAHEFVEVKF